LWQSLKDNRPRVLLFLLFLILGATLGGTLYLWRCSALTVDQRIGAVTASLTASAVLIAGLAFIIAVQAYRDGLRRPVL